MNACMTSMTKTATPEVSVGLYAAFAAIVAKIRAAVDSLAPIGYQDETGFHTGVKPRNAEAAGMSEW